METKAAERPMIDIGYHQEGDNQDHRSYLISRDPYLRGKFFSFMYYRFAFFTSKSSQEG